MRTTGQARPRLVPLLAGALVLAGLSMPAAAAPKAPSPGKNYTAAPAPTPVTSVPLGDVARLTLTNCGTCSRSGSALAFGSAELRVPVAAGLAASAASVRVSGGWTDTVTTDGAVAVIRVTAGNAAAVAPNAAVTVEVDVPATATLGEVRFTTQVKQSNDFSGSGNDFTRAGPEPAVTLVPPPPHSLQVLTPVSPVQSGTSTASSDVVPRLVMCPAPRVKVLDASGRGIAGRTVELTAAAGAGLQLGAPGAWSAAVSATSGADGVAVFGDCDASPPTGVGAGGLGSFPVTAAAGSVTAPAGTLTSLRVYGDCTGSCASTIDGDRGTRAGLQATTAGLDTQRLTFTADPPAAWSSAYAAACDPDPGALGVNTERDVVTVDVAERSKTLQLTWTKRAVQWATNNGASQWRVCLAAVYPFPSDGYTTPQEDGTFSSPGTPPAPQPTIRESETLTWYVGALLPCSDPAAAGYPCLDRLGRSGGSQVATVLVPDVDGDPKIF